MNYTITAAEWDDANAWAIKLVNACKETKLDKGHYKIYPYEQAVKKQTMAFIAQMLVARYLDLEYHHEINTFKNKADVGEDHEVKHSEHEHGRLIVSDKERPLDMAWLVIGSGTNYRIAGWIPMEYARRDIYRHAVQDNYWIPQAALALPEMYKESMYDSTNY